MHEATELREVVIQGAIFALSVITAYAAAYGLSAFWYRIVRRADPVTRGRSQLPAAWLLFNTYLVGGLAGSGALPTGTHALWLATVLMFGLTLPLWIWSRLRGRSGTRPSTAALLLAVAVPWLAAWLVQWIMA